MKKKHKLRNTFLGIIIVPILLVVVSNVIWHINRASAEMPTGWDVEDYDLYMQSKKDIPSDIEGMSQYDKYKMGLDYADGSDSDFDGLSDKEEIEVHGSDPLKASTAGDLYTDGYKAAHQMDLMQAYEYTGTIKFDYNACSEVSLEPDEPSDLYAVVEDYTDAYSLECFGIDEIYAGYHLYNYNGTVSIDLEPVLDKNSIAPSDIHVWVMQGDFVVNGVSKLRKCKYSRTGNQITLKYEFDNKSGYCIYVTGKKHFRIGSLLHVDAGMAQEREQGIGLMYGSPVVEFFTKRMHIEYSELDTKERTDSLIGRVVDYCNQYAGSKYTKNDTDILEAKSKLEINYKYKIMQKVFPFLEFKPGDEVKPYHLLFYYMSYADSAQVGATGENGSAVDRDSNSNRNSGFDKYVDELPFQNFESYIGTTGNCAGIAHLTSYLYNTGSFPTSGSYECQIDGERRKVTWDLTKDKENKTLSDKGLYDYKTTTFVDDHSEKHDNYLRDGLTNGERNFVKMIGCYWAEGNDRIDLNDYMTEYSIQSKHPCLAHLAPP